MHIPDGFLNAAVVGTTYVISSGGIANAVRMAKNKIIQDIAEKYKATPQITQIMEFGLKKNGIRFPTRYVIEEAYIKKNNKKIVHSETIVLYKDYKFFTVETEIKYVPESNNL